MFRDGRLGERKFIDDVTAHPRFLPGQHAQNEDADRVGNGLGERRQFLIRGGAVYRRGRSEGLGIIRWAAQRFIDRRVDR